ncbi:hypothetical protein B0H19DRAFT_318883 [Mycena capillaripes]|nr:hypothetical protein B0H19DRAFT_318883 [Mycena capillaripes]
MQQPAPGTQSTGGVGLYWPWGRSSAAPTSTSTPALSPPPTATATAKHSPPAPAPQQDEAEDSSDSENESLASSALLASTTLETLETPPTSPVGAGPRGLVGFVERSWGGAVAGVAPRERRGDDDVRVVAVVDPVAVFARAVPVAPADADTDDAAPAERGGRVVEFVQGVCAAVVFCGCGCGCGGAGVNGWWREDGEMTVPDSLLGRFGGRHHRHI